jgi:hypothetical protein
MVFRGGWTVEKGGEICSSPVDRTDGSPVEGRARLRSGRGMRDVDAR